MQEPNELTLEELLALGRLGLQMGYWEQAEEYYRRALALAPGHAEALLGLARACRDPAQALEAVRALLAASPDSEEGLRLKRELTQRVAAEAPRAEPPPEQPSPLPPQQAIGGRVWTVALLALAVLLLMLAVLRMAGGRPEHEAELSAPHLLPEALEAGMALTPATPDVPATLPAKAATLTRALDATALVLVPDENAVLRTQGSAVVVDEAGLVLTNYHVVADKRSGLLNADGLAFVGFARDVRRPPDEWYIAVTVAHDPTRDLAILRLVATAEGRSVVGRRFNALPLRTGDEPALGEGLIGLGYPRLGGETLTLTRGSMAGYLELGPVRLGKTDSQLLPGSSGGAVLDAEGRLAGVITLVVSEERTQGRLSYFVLIDEAQALLAAARQASPPSVSLHWMRELYRQWMRPD